MDIRATFEGRNAEQWARERRHDALANMVKDEVPTAWCTAAGRVGKGRLSGFMEGFGVKGVGWGIPVCVCMWGAGCACVVR